MSSAEHLESRAPSAPTRPHASYCGGSDIAAILGIDPFRTPLAVWCEKTGRIADEPSPEMEAGNDHEAGVIAGYTRRVVQRAQLVRHVIYPGPGTLISPKDPRRGATPDALAEHIVRGLIDVQAKFVGHGMAREWGPEEDGPEGVPEHVLVQVHWETLHLREHRGVRGEVAHVAADLGTDRRAYEVPIDDALISDLLDAFNDWWRRHVELDEMPIVEARDRETIARLYPRALRPVSEDQPPAEIAALAEQYEKVRAAESLVSLEKERVAALLTAQIGEGGGYRGIWGKAVWREQARTRTDWKTISQALGAPAELVAAHTTTTPSRVLDVKLKKEW